MQKANLAKRLALFRSCFVQNQWMAPVRIAFERAFDG